MMIMKSVQNNNMMREHESLYLSMKTSFGIFHSTEILIYSIPWATKLNIQSI